MSKFRKPGKQAAYEQAQRYMTGYDDEYLSTPLTALVRLTKALKGEYPSLALGDTLHVAATALRVEMERRAAYD